MYGTAVPGKAPDIYVMTALRPHPISLNVLSRSPVLWESFVFISAITGQAHRPVIASLDRAWRSFLAGRVRSAYLYDVLHVQRPLIAQHDGRAIETRVVRCGVGSAEYMAGGFYNQAA